MQNFAFGIKIRKSIAHLRKSVHGIIYHTKTAINPTTILFGEQHIKIFFFVDLVRFLVDSLTTKLIFRPETIISLTAQPNDPFSLPLDFEKTWGSLAQAC